MYGMNGAPLQPQHGYPLRLLVPGWYGMASVKWLSRIEAIDHQFDGYQQMRTYRYIQSADDVGDPVDLIRVRSLMVPPGVPDFLTRTRLVEAGTHRVEGRAWAGRLDVTRVEFSCDGGRTWTDADLGTLRRRIRLALVVCPVGGQTRRARPVCPRHRRRGQRTAHRAALELPRHGQQHDAQGRSPGRIGERV